jgi:hypothetical protein
MQVPKLDHSPMAVNRVSNIVQFEGKFSSNKKLDYYNSDARELMHLNSFKELAARLPSSPGAIVSTDDDVPQQLFWMP